jgi:hypothetical protein
MAGVAGTASVSKAMPTSDPNLRNFVVLIFMIRPLIIFVVEVSVYNELDR